MIYRQAVEADAPAMGRMMVDTYMAAHKGQIPEAAWLQRQREWTPEVSAANWARSIRDIANGDMPQTCIYVAVDESAAQAGEADNVAGICMGGPGDAMPWPNCGDIYAMYVSQDYQRRGVGRRLLQAVVGWLAQAGLTSLTIRALMANTPALRFYAGLGGQIVGTCEADEYGVMLSEQIFGWADIATFPVD